MHEVETKRKTRGDENMNKNWRRHAILGTLVGMLFAAAPLFGQAKAEGAKSDRTNVLLRFVKEGTVSASCSETLGIIEQSMLQVEGVKNVKIDPKNNGVEVSYDSGKTTPEKIVAAFNKGNLETPLRSPRARRAE